MWLSDEALERLRAQQDPPDLSGTRYRLVRPIGRGGMGAVFLADDTVLQRRVAMKVLHATDPTGQMPARLLREARILAQLEHPGIVPVHDVGTLADGRVFYTMKYVEGQRLDALAAGTMAVSGRLRTFQRICEAVAFAHAHGVIHRDLKPENVMVGPFGEVLVMDWGIAKILRAAAQEESPRPAACANGDESATAHGTVLGTAGYMAPEQARGEVESVSEPADIYALGAILRFLLAGTADDLPRPLAAICSKAMAAEPSARYASAQDLAADAGRYLDGLPVSAYPESIVEKAGRFISRHQVWIILLLTYLIVRVLLLLWFRR